MAGRNKILIPILITFIAIVFVYLGYTLFVPKSNGVRSKPSSPQTSFALQQSVKIDNVNPLRLDSDPFKPLVVKLNENSFEDLIKTSALSTRLNRNVYVVGMAKGLANMVTLYVGGEILTLNLSDNSIFYLDGKKYFITYIAPSFGSVVIMDSSNGNLYIINSQGLILR